MCGGGESNFERYLKMRKRERLLVGVVQKDQGKFVG